MTLAADLERYFDRLQAVWPPRSLTGPGTAASHDILEAASGQKFTRIHVATGTKIFDWECPPTWTLRDAYVIAPGGKKILDARANHLHVVNYSVPINERMARSQLERHLHSLPDQPDAVPYRQVYYTRDWGFCISHHDRIALPEGEYQCVVDADLAPGNLEICELVLPGETDKETLIWCYTCHPATMAHHDLSANLAWAYLLKRVAAWPKRRFTYRFVCGAETIGSLAYLAQECPGYRYGSFPRSAALERDCISGYVMTCLGRGAWNYKRTKRGDTLADRAVDYLRQRDTNLKHVGSLYDADVHDYYVHEGSDELVFNRFDLPVGSLMRDRYAHFDSYHTDQDTKATISFATIADSIDVYERVLKVIEANRTYRCLVPGVPQLGRRGLYSEADIVPQTVCYQLSDGSADLLDLARRTGLDIHVLADAAKRAESAGVLEEVA